MIRDSCRKMFLHLFVYEHINVHLWFDDFRILMNYAPVMHCDTFCCYLFTYIIIYFCIYYICFTYVYV